MSNTVDIGISVLQEQHAQTRKLTLRRPRLFLSVASLGLKRAPPPHDPFDVFDVATLALFGRRNHMMTQYAPNTFITPIRFEVLEFQAVKSIPERVVRWCEERQVSRAGE